MEEKKVVLLSVHLLCLSSLFSLSLAAATDDRYYPLDRDEGRALDALKLSWQGVDLFAYAPAFDSYYYDQTFCYENSEPRYIKFNCSSDPLRIVYLDLRGASLNGSILPDIGSFTALTYLDLSRNNLDGTIPEELGRLTNLVFLDLSFNKLNGPIPPSLQNLTALHFLYLGSNNLEGHFPFAPGSSLEALDLSFNPISGSLENGISTLSINTLGTSVQQTDTTGREKQRIYNCIPGWSCNITDPNGRTQFAVNCGGTRLKSSSILYYGDEKVQGGAFFHVDSVYQWAVSNIGSDAPGRNVETKYMITASLDQELYKTAITSPKSLRYIVFGLKKGNYCVTLHFAEIVVSSQTRLFDVYIQGERKLTDFNILNETSSPLTALVKSFYTQVNASFIDIHFLQAARWNCCGPRDSVLGPLVSAISLTQVEESSEPQADPGRPKSPENQPPSSTDPPGFDSARTALRRRGRISGIVLLSTAIIFVASSVFYLWWIKDSTTGHIRIRTDSPRS